MTALTKTLNLRTGVLSFGDRASACLRWRFSSDFGRFYGAYRVSATCTAHFLPFLCIVTFSSAHKLAQGDR